MVMESDCGLDKQIEHRHCRSCVKPLIPTRQWQKFCSSACRDHWHNEERRKALAVYRAQWVKVEK